MSIVKSERRMIKMVSGTCFVSLKIRVRWREGGEDMEGRGI